MTLEEMIAKVERFEKTVPETGHQIMREQVYAGKTNKKSGDLGNSIVKQQIGPHTWFIGSYLHYAKIINNGRREVTPHGHPYLKWEDVPFYPNRMNVINNDYSHVYARHSKAVAPDNFVGRTADLLRLLIKSLW